MLNSKGKLLGASIPVIKFTNELAQSQKSMLITVGIHGNEQCGMLAFNQLLEEGFFNDLSKFKWSGNPNATEMGVRFIDSNLNRIFADEINPLNEGYEYTLVSELKNLIKRCDSYLDLHSTSSSSDAFAIAINTEASKKFAETFPVKFVIEDIVSTLKGTTLQCAFECGVKCAVCVECGHHYDKSTIQKARACIIHFLIETGFNSYHPLILSCASYQILNEGFRFAKDFGAFQFVKFGELIATDDASGEIKCPYQKGAYLIMPVSHPHTIGEEAWFWGVLKD